MPPPVPGLLLLWRDAVLNEACGGISLCLGVGLPGDSALEHVFSLWAVQAQRLQDRGRKVLEAGSQWGHLVGLKLWMQGPLMLMVASLRKRAGLSDEAALSDDWRPF